MLPITHKPVLIISPIVVTTINKSPVNIVSKPIKQLSSRVIATLNLINTAQTKLRNSNIF